MVEANWFLVDPLSVLQAASLWAGIEPHPKPYFLWPDGDRRKVQPFLQMLFSGIALGQLRALIQREFETSIGDHSSSLVSRHDLTAFAEFKKQRPAFLFDTLLPVEDQTKPTADAITRNVGGRPQKWDWDAFVAEIVRIADMDGLPDKQAELVRILQEWFIHKTGDHPAESETKARVSRIYNKLGRGRKPTPG